MPERPTSEELNRSIEEGIMTFQEYAKKEHDVPYVFELKEGSKSLTYYGAGHSHNPEDPMFVDIEQRFKAPHPQVVIVEGVNQLVEQKERFRSTLRGVTREGVIKKMGESAFALKLAMDSNIEVESPEPQLSEEIQYLIQTGFEKEDIFAFYLYRSANQYQRTPQTPSIEEYLQPDAEEFKAATNWENFDYSIENLKTIGHRLWGNRSALDSAEFSEERIDPVPWDEKKDEQTVVNQIAAQSSFFRDRFMVKRLQKILKEKDSVLVVFGVSHAYMQEPALRKIFESFK